jgi:hypothetical protein
MRIDNYFIEQRIIEAVKKTLKENVNDILSEAKFSIPTIELGNFQGGNVIVPTIELNTCERSEKERILYLDAYTLTITFKLPETPESELYLYAYSAAVGRAFYDNPTLEGVANRTVITGKKYLKPKSANCGENWSLVIAIRLTVEGVNYAR